MNPKIPRRLIEYSTLAEGLAYTYGRIWAAMEAASEELELNFFEFLPAFSDPQVLQATILDLAKLVESFDDSFWTHYSWADSCANVGEYAANVLMVSSDPISDPSQEIDTLDTPFQWELAEVMDEFEPANFPPPAQTAEIPEDLTT